MIEAIDIIRYDVNNNRYKEQDDGSYWAGLSNNMSWRKAPTTDKDFEHQYLWFCTSTQEYVSSTRHPDGCFKCPRCKCYHYVPDNYELLCDTCVSIVIDHPKAKPEQVEGIKLWNNKKRAHWSGNIDADIVDRLQLRDKLVAETEGLMFTG